MDLYQRFNELMKKDNNRYEENVIGVLSEKTLHKTIKNLYEYDHTFHEVKINNYYVDICKGNEIIEVQTKQFNKLKEKIQYLLSLGEYKINIVYPVFTQKMIYQIDNNSLSFPKKSPKKIKLPEIFHELYMIKSLLKNPSLTITILFFEIDEYRQTANNRKGYICYDRIPTKLVKELVLNRKEEYLEFLPEGLNDSFTANDICEKSKCKLKYVNKMLNVLKYLEVVEVVGKEGRKFVYNVKKG